MTGAINRGETTSIGQRYHVDDDNPGNNTISQGVHSFRTYVRSADESTLQHQQRRTSPGIYMPPTSRVVVRQDVTKWTCVETNGFRTRTFDNISHGAWYMPDPHERKEQLARLAFTRAVAQLKNQSVNLSQAFAERAQTARLVEGNAMRIAKSILELRKGNLKGAAAALGIKRGVSHASREIGERWLELQYGWKPLLSDVYGSMVALHNADMDNPNRYYVSVKGNASEKISFPVDDPNYNGGYHVRGYCSGSIRAFVRGDYKLDNPVLAQASSLGLTNPLAIAWELTPWSFVADWFLPVGNYLNNLDATVGWSRLGVSVSVRTSYNFTGSRVTADALPSEVNAGPSFSGYGCTVSGDSLERGGWIVEGAIAQLPQFKNPLSLGHLANALSLLRGSVR